MKVEDRNKKKLCIFSHYYEGDFIPFYVIVYINELKNYFDEILVVTNKRAVNNISEIADSEIKTLLIENEGYDFGMFFKAFQIIDFQDYKQIACINDSNIIFGSLSFLFELGKQSGYGFLGFGRFLAKTQRNTVYEVLSCTKPLPCF